MREIELVYLTSMNGEEYIWIGHPVTVWARLHEDTAHMAFIRKRIELWHAFTSRRWKSTFPKLAPDFRIIRVTRPNSPFEAPSEPGAQKAKR